MDETRRSILEPHDWIQRILYAILTFTTPYCVVVVYPKTGDDLFLVTMFFWWIVCAFYTISSIVEWIRRRVK